jgi:glycosyltransferase involved in cell wall biosynthesis
VTWANEFRAGEEVYDGLRVIRFPVRRKRRLRRFHELSDRVFTGYGSPEEEERWFLENGPQVPELLKYLRREGPSFDLVLFWSYRYYHSFFGLPLVAGKSVLVPTAEEDPAINLKVLGEFFRQPRGLLFLTPEERELVASVAAGPLPPSLVVGAGLEAPSGDDGREQLLHLGVEPPYVLYMGRVDVNKGCDHLVRHYMRHVESGGSRLPLILAGKRVMPMPAHPLLRPLGFVSEEAREALLANARMLLMPSPYESLSLVLLEAWNHGVPALVNGRCKVLRGQMLRANGGLYYENFPEFSACLEALATRPEQARTFGLQGRRYVEENYRWPVIMARLEEFMSGVSSNS